MNILCRRRLILLLSIWAFLTIPIFGQVKEWGDISREDLVREVYQPDSSASAVVLFDKGTLRVEDNLEYYLDRHTRIKLIRPDGYDWGTVKLDFNEGYDQEIDDLEAVTYTLEDDGDDIEDHKLGKRDFFEEEIVNNWNRITFTFPSLEPGCIIEYRYTHKIGDPAYIPIWYFDWNIPVKWNELTAEFPSFLKFTKVFKGDEELYRNEVDGFSKTIRLTYEVNPGGYAGSKTSRQRIRFNGDRYRWVMKDRPAIPELPFMTAPDDYKAQILLQLSELYIPNQVQQDFVKNWDNVIQLLLEHEDFASYLDSQSEYEQIISSVPEAKTEVEKTRQLFDHVANSYTWDGSYGIFASHTLEEVVTSQRGSGAELNLLLTGSLRQTGIRAYPVLISTRGHGAVLENYVLPNQFNHVIVLVKLDDHDLLLDASRGNRPLYLLPKNDLNGRGLVVKPSMAGQEEWVSLEPLKESVRAAFVEAKISPDGSLSGTISGISSGYLAIEDRELISREGEEAFAEETLFKNFSTYEFASLDITQTAMLDSTLNYTSSLESGLAAETQVVDSTIYLDTVPVLKWSENPLKQEERKYPVDFPYAFSEQLVISYEIPEGYEVVEYPERLVSRITNSGGMFSRTVQVKESQVVVRSVIELGRPEYTADEYDRLKLFFDQILDAHSEKIVLQKTMEN